MGHNCEILLTESAVLPLVPGALGKKFEEILFDCMVLSYSGVRFCPGPDCSVIVMALEESCPKRVRVHIFHLPSATCLQKTGFEAGFQLKIQTGY